MCTHGVPQAHYAHRGKPTIAPRCAGDQGRVRVKSQYLANSLAGMFSLLNLPIMVEVGDCCALGC